MSKIISDTFTLWGIFFGFGLFFIMAANFLGHWQTWKMQKRLEKRLEELIPIEELPHMKNPNQFPTPKFSRPKDTDIQTRLIAATKKLSTLKKVQNNLKDKDKENFNKVLDFFAQHQIEPEIVGSITHPDTKNYHDIDLIIPEDAMIFLQGLMEEFNAEIKRDQEIQYKYWPNSIRYYVRIGDTLFHFLIPKSFKGSNQNLSTPTT